MPSSRKTNEDFSPAQKMFFENQLQEKKLHEYASQAKADEDYTPAEKLYKSSPF